MRFELFMGLRYLKSKRKNFFISFITVISVAGVMVGVTALITVLAVMTGFDRELRDKMLGNKSHLTIERTIGSLTDYATVVEEIERDPDVVAAAPFVGTQALVSISADEMSSAFILGIDPERQSGVTNFAANLREGALREGGIVLGSGIARMLRVRVGDMVTLVTARKFSTFLGYRPATKSFKVTGIYHSGMYEFDSVSAFLLLEDARKMAGVKEGVTSVQVRLRDPLKAEQALRRIVNRLGPAFWGQTWIDQHRTFWYALKQEKIVMFIILSLVVMVAAFNIVSTLVMVVMEKRRDIGLLRSVGTPTRSIMGIFVFEGLTAGVVGMLLGLAGGVALANSLNRIKDLLEQWFGISVFPSDIYIFDEIPVQIQAGDVVAVTVLAVLICFLATLYPAWQASHLNPVECLRYE